MHIVDIKRIEEGSHGPMRPVVESECCGRAVVELLFSVATAHGIVAV